MYQTTKNDAFFATREYQQMLKMRPAADRVICAVFDVAPKDIKRLTHEEGHILDVRYHIDVEVMLKCRTYVTLQEKALENRFAFFKTFTVEYYQNKNTGEEGEFFHINSDYYLHGYGDLNNTNYLIWAVVDVPAFKLWVNTKSDVWIQAHIKGNTNSRASFFAVPYKQLPGALFLATSWTRPQEQLSFF